MKHFEIFFDFNIRMYILRIKGYVKEIIEKGLFNFQN